MIDVHNVKDIKQWFWPHFKPEELRCRGDGSLIFNEGTLDLLEKARGICGFPFIVSSGYRSPDYNVKVAETGKDGPHTTGQAIDIVILGAQALELIQVAAVLGFTGIGLKQHDDVHKRMVHLDNLNATPERPRPWVWTYP